MSKNDKIRQLVRKASYTGVDERKLFKRLKKMKSGQGGYVAALADFHNRSERQREKKQRRQRNINRAAWVILGALIVFGFIAKFFLIK